MKLKLDNYVTFQIVYLNTGTLFFLGCQFIDYWAGRQLRGERGLPHRNFLASEGNADALKLKASLAFKLGLCVYIWWHIG